jgi:hypothetical protein
VITRILDSVLKLHFPCAKVLILNKLLADTSYVDIAGMFMTPKKPDLVFTDGALPWNASGTYQLGETIPSSVSTSTSQTIMLNTSMLQNSSQLLIAAAMIHETLHAVINYNITTAAINYASGYNTLGTWVYGIDSWLTINGLPANYSGHYEMISAFFDKAVGMLAKWDNNAHTTKEYQMTMLYGLDNAQDGTQVQKDSLNSVYNKLLSKDGITSSDLNTYYTNNLNASSAQKLPTSGCP